MFFCILNLLGCQHGLREGKHQLKHNQTVHQALKQTYYDVNIISFDGTQLRATVYQPALSAEQTAPLILHSHSFSTFRMSQPFSMYGTIMFAGKTALELWRAGYWVISFDQRGHGDSGDNMHMMSQNYEIKDVSAIISWAERNLPRLTVLPAVNKSIAQTDISSIPKTKISNTVIPNTAIGMLGESYSGSMQLLASTQDARIDALVPIHTWYDLGPSLFPQQVMKGWVTTLILAGNALNYNRVDLVINQGYLMERKQGLIEEAFNQELSQRSFKHFCDRQIYPQADALIMQGFGDSLFGFNEGIQIRRCFQQAERDVRFIGTQIGHLLPLVQHDGLMTFHNVDAQVQCDNHTYSTQQMVMDWFDEKLKGRAQMARYIPPVCLTLNRQRGITLNDIPVGGEIQPWVKAQISSGYAGFWNHAPGLSNKVEPDKTVGVQHSNPGQPGGWIRPVFVPFKKIQTNTYLVGTPLLHIKVQGEKNSPPPTIFVGIGRQRNKQTQLISEQITPVKGNGDFHLMMNGISDVLQKDDQLGLLVYGYHNQYRIASSGFRTRASITAQVELPLLTIEDKNLPVIDQQLFAEQITEQQQVRFKTWQDLAPFYQKAYHPAIATQKTQ